MRTYTRADLAAARAAWDEGDFSAEWRDVRHYAAMGGLIYPPTGSKWDTWDDDQPSQRAMLIRAIRETPDLLRRCIAGARSWSEVIGRLTRARDDWRGELAERDRDAAWERDEPTPREATMTLKAILDRLADS